MDEKERNELHAARLRGAVDGLLKNPDGRYFLRWIVEKTGTLEAGFPLDHAKAAFSEGQRSVGCAIFALVVERGGADKILAEDVNNA